MTGIKGLILAAGRVISYAITLAIGIALLVFFWGLVKYIFKADSPQSKDEGKNIMIWGVVTLFIMVSVWGVIKAVQSDLDVRLGPVPVIRGGGGGGDGGGNSGGGNGGGNTGGGGSLPPCGPFSYDGIPCD